MKSLHMLYAERIRPTPDELHVLRYFRICLLRMNHLGRAMCPGIYFDRQGGPTRILRSEKAEPIKS